MNMATTALDYENSDGRFDNEPLHQTVSRKTLPFSASIAWQKVCFYEHVKLQPSLFLRSILPTPLGTTGCHGEVGDTSRCLYSDGGYLTKRMTTISEGELLRFEIVEQTIRFHSVVKLLGGSIQVIPVAVDRCEIEMITHYQSRLQPRRVFDYFVKKVIKSMHRIVFDDMRVECGR